MNIIEYLKQQEVISKEKSQKFIKMLEKYEENDILYNTALAELDLTNEEYEALFSELEKENYVDSIYIIQCPFCDSLGNTYVEKFDIPEFDQCRFCQEEFNHRENYQEAFRLYFNYHKEIDILSELSQKISGNQDRIFEISEEIKELETNRKDLQNENIKFITLRDELMYDKTQSKSYNKVNEQYKGEDIKYIGTLIYMKKCVLKCSKCGETYELFDIGDKKIGICPTCENEIELVLK